MWIFLGKCLFVIGCQLWNYCITTRRHVSSHIDYCSCHLPYKTKNQGNDGDAGYRTPYLSHAKRALYHVSYIPMLFLFSFFFNYSLYLKQYHTLIPYLSPTALWFSTTCCFSRHGSHGNRLTEHSPEKTSYLYLHGNYPSFPFTILLLTKFHFFFIFSTLVTFPRNHGVNFFFFKKFVNNLCDDEADIVDCRMILLRFTKRHIGDSSTVKFTSLVSTWCEPSSIP